MEEGFYRILLTILAGVAVLVAGAITLSLVLADPAGAAVSARDIARLVGYGLVPVAAIGLWSWRRWGFWMLGLATLTTFVADFPEGVFAAFWRAFLHLTMILLTVEQHYARKIPEDDDDAE
jgi:hypothetical protein